MPNGGSREAIKSDSCEKCINWVACGSYLKERKSGVNIAGQQSRAGHLLGPANVEHLQVVLDDADLLFLVRLVEVLQDDGYVHVDHYHVADDDEAGEVGYGQQGVAAVAVRLAQDEGVAVRRLDHERLQHIVPPGGGHQPEQQLHAPAERLEVHHVVEGSLKLDVAEERHAQDGVDERDQSQQGADVEEGRQGHDQGEEQLPYALGCLDQAQDASDAEHSDYAQQRGTDGQVDHDVLHQDAKDGG